MADISKITGIAIASVAKVCGAAIANISKVIGNVYASFANTQAVSRSLTDGTAESVYLADSNASGIEFDQDDAFSVSFWIKPGWDSSHNGNIHLFSSTDVGGGVNSDTFRMWYALYWNGTSCGTGFYASGNNAGTPAMGNNDKQVFLGSSSWTPYTSVGNNSETKYDGLTMWNKKLTATEVAELYNSGTPMDATSHSAATNLKGYWEFEVDGTATVGENMTVNGNSNIETR